MSEDGCVPDWFEHEKPDKTKFGANIPRSDSFHAIGTALKTNQVFIIIIIRFISLYDAQTLL